MSASGKVVGAAFRASGIFPPALDDSGWAMVTIMGVLAGTLLLLHWMYQVIHALCHDGAPLSHPITVSRLVKIGLLFCALLRTIPRFLQITVWGVIQPSQREVLSLLSWVTYIPWAIILVLIWWIDQMAEPVIRMQMLRWPTPSVKWWAVKASDVRRGALALLLIFAVAFATAYIRPGVSQRVDKPSYSHG